jgi:hypothetical protein
MLTVQKCSYEPFGCTFTGRTGDVIEHCQDPACMVYHERIENEHTKDKNQQIMILLRDFQSGLNMKIPEKNVTKSPLNKASSLIKNTKKEDDFILPKLNINRPPTKKKMIFSNFSKGDNIKIFNKGCSIIGIRSAYEVAQLSDSVLPYQTFTFSIDFLGSPISIGLGDSNKLLGNNFAMRYQMVNHGCFMLANNGNHLVDNRAGFFFPGKTMTFAQGDIISFVYEYDRSRIVFTKAGTGEGTAVYLPKIIDPKNLKPTVFVYDNKSQVTFLQSSN